MGWNPYNVFGLDYGEEEVISQAEMLTTLGLDRLGYRYVNVDDGWWLRRDGDTIRVRTSIYPSAALPDGTTSLQPFVNRLHAMGLKAGIYTDIGRNICSQRWQPGSPNLPEGSVREREVGTYGHHQADAALLFAKWGFDLIKIDACGVADFAADVAEVKQGQFRAFRPLIARERPNLSEPVELARQYAGFVDAAWRASPSIPPLISICAWGQADVNDWAPKYGQMWRTSFDISPTWRSMLFNFDSSAARALFAGPGRWNDPDMLEVGNGEFDQRNLIAARAHMSMWAIIAAPLILGNDLRRMTPAIAKIIANRDVIAVNQDPAGNQGVIISKSGDGQIVAKAMSRPGRKAIALINRGRKPIALSVSVADLGLSPAGALAVHDLWTGHAVATPPGRVATRLAPQETRLLMLDGQPLRQAIDMPADMPARFDVADEGYKAPDRTPERQWVLASIGFLPYGERLMLGRAHDHAGLGVAAGSRIGIDLNGEYQSVSLAPRMPYTGSGRFEVRGDGRVLAKGVASTKVHMLSLDVRNVRKLELVAPSPTRSATTFAWHRILMKRAAFSANASGSPIPAKSVAGRGEVRHEDR